MRWLVLVLTGCVGAFGGSAGMSIDTRGHVGVMLQGFSAAGSRGAVQAEVETGVFWLPQLSLGAGWDFATAGPVLEAGCPLFGYARAGHGRSLTTTVRAAAVLSWPRHGRFRIGGGGAVAMDLGEIAESSTSMTTYDGTPDRPARSFHALGLHLDGLLGGDAGGLFGRFVAGAGYQYQSFFNMYYE